MASEVEIANLVAVRMGSPARVTSLDDDRTLARTLKAVWATERQATIRDGSWNFAAARDALAALAPDSGVVIHPWTYAYRLPAQCLRLIEVLGVARADYSREGDNLILCDAPAPLYVRYAIDVPEIAKWDAEAVAAFALRLAWRCGHKIAGSAFDAQACWAEYRAAIAAAKSTDAQENPPISTAEEDDSWISARNGAWR